MKHGLSRILLIVAGSLSVILAVVGMFFPVLPTTPFLLLAAFCFVRSSPRFYLWLIRNRWFGSYIRNYRQGLGLPLKQKVFTIALLWLSIGYTAGFVVPAWWGKLILVGIALGVSIHLLKIKTHRPAVETTAFEPGSGRMSERLEHIPVVDRVHALVGSEVAPPEAIDPGI